MPGPSQQLLHVTNIWQAILSLPSINVYVNHTQNLKVIFIVVENSSMSVENFKLENSVGMSNRRL